VIPYYLHDRPEVREGLAGYYEQISQMDAGIGMVLAALREAGRAEETLVIFFSDHGSSEPGAMANLYEPARGAHSLSRPSSTAQASIEQEHRADHAG
jgi:N-sulfoglucosamine sulfohydrolase